MCLTHIHRQKIELLFIIEEISELIVYLTNGGGGAGAFFVVDRDVGGGARGTKLNGGGISVSFNCISS